MGEYIAIGIEKAFGDHKEIFSEALANGRTTRAKSLLSDMREFYEDMKKYKQQGFPIKQVEETGRLLEHLESQINSGGLG